MNFHPFAQAVHARYMELAKHELFVAGTHEMQDRLYDHYLASFPEGTNPIFRTKTEHDCSCCRNFIKNLGSKTMCQPTAEQLSGLGFSSTRGDTVTIRAQTDKGQRTFNIQF